MLKIFLIAILLIPLPGYSKPFKIGMGFAQGLFSQSENNISSSALLSPGVQFTLKISEKFVFGTGTNIYLDFSTGSVFLNSLQINSLYYFKGKPFKEYIENEGDQITTLSKWAFASGIELKNYKYFLGNDIPVTSNLKSEGSFYNLNLLAQADYRLNSNWELSANTSFSLLSFGSSENGVKLNSILLTFGLNYLVD